MIRLSKRDSEEPMYDSSAETQEHIDKVSKYMSKLSEEIDKRGKEHDKSKLGKEEKPYFDKATPELKKLEFGTKEYEESLKILKPALNHHYKVNRHHPEYHDNGVEDMDLVDLTEMVCDWVAASQRTKDGDAMKSVEICSKRFKVPEQLKSIIINTVKRLQK